MSNRSVTFRRHISLAVVLTLAIVPSATDDVFAADAAPAAGSESLGSGLLNDLDPDLFGVPENAVEPVPAKPSFQKRILPDLTDDRWIGEDVGQSPEHVLAWVERNMETAAALLPEDESLPRAGEAQQQVVADLDKLIQELARQCRSGACNSSGECKSPSQRTASAPKPGAPKPGQGQSAARDSTGRIGQGDPHAAVDPAQREQLLKDLWGHLPPRAREQLLQSYSDEFLPEYELEIEKYFQRLAEEPER